MFLIGTDNLSAFDRVQPLNISFLPQFMGFISAASLGNNGYFLFSEGSIASPNTSHLELFSETIVSAHIIRFAVFQWESGFSGSKMAPEASHMAFTLKISIRAKVGNC